MTLLLLVPCLVTDPGTAVVFTRTPAAFSFSTRSQISRFEQEALAARIASIRGGGPITQWLGRLLGHLKRTPTAVPQDVKKRIIRMAENLGDSDPELYDLVARYLEIRGGVAVDIGTGGFFNVARGLLTAGVQRVICIDDQEKSSLEGVSLPPQIERSLQDAFHLRIENEKIRVAVFNESLDWLLRYRQESLRQNASVDRKPVYRDALTETFRILEPGGWVLIKTGNYAANKPGHQNWDVRLDEGPLCESLLHEMGFKDVETLKSGATPVLLWARKPPIFAPNGDPKSSFESQHPGSVPRVIDPRILRAS